MLGPDLMLTKPGPIPYTNESLESLDPLNPVHPTRAAPSAGAAIFDLDGTLYRALYRPKLLPLPGLLALLDRLAAAGVRLGVASAAPLENRALVLDGLGLRARFHQAIGAEHAARGKPHPDLFLAAAAALGVAPAACVAFEDALLGVEAALAAGMQVAAVTTTQTAAALRGAGCRWVLADFREMPGELAAALGI